MIPIEIKEDISTPAKKPQVGDKYASLWSRLRGVGHLRITHITRLGDDVSYEVGVYLKSSFVYPEPSEEDPEVFMGTTHDPELWFRMRSYGPVDIRRVEL